MFSLLKNEGKTHILSYFIVILLRMGLFMAWMGGDKKSPLPKICHTYATMMKVDAVVPKEDRIKSK